MLGENILQQIRSRFDGKGLVVEGANGSLGLSLSLVLREINVKPSQVLLTTFESDPHHYWSSSFVRIHHLKSSDPDFSLRRSEIIRSFRTGVNVIYGSGYGRPNLFLSDGAGVIRANVQDLLGYSELSNVESLAYMSTAELYTGSVERVDEHSPLISTPQHPRGVYIEAKRLGESITENILSKTIKRVASYRIALAMPPVMLKNDGRVLADLIGTARKNGHVRLKGGSSLVRQYQYGPNAVYKLLGSLVNGDSSLYINAGPHIVTLAELAALVAKIYKVPLTIEDNLEDSSSPSVVLLDSTRIDVESGYLHFHEDTLEGYIRKMTNA